MYYVIIVIFENLSSLFNNVREERKPTNAQLQISRAGQHSQQY
jgi:hypothetical protein